METKSKSYRLPVDLLDRVAALAEAGDTTETKVIVNLLQYSLAAMEKGENVLEVAEQARQNAKHSRITTTDIDGLEDLIERMIRDRLGELVA
ncbi:hypothetical protein NDA03_26035 [Trichocoleus sp. Lan]|uniref:hypothetical protein n=1 Tax=Trichocoleus sp. Lan TaxID=2933927 RepID=UPI003297A237